MPRRLTTSHHRRFRPLGVLLGMLAVMALVGFVPGLPRVAEWQPGGGMSLVLGAEAADAETTLHRNPALPFLAPVPLTDATRTTTPHRGDRLRGRHVGGSPATFRVPQYLDRHPRIRIRHDAPAARRHCPRSDDGDDLPSEEGWA